MRELIEWLKENNTTEVECLIPDMTGNARGKILPAAKFLHDNGIRHPEGVFIQTVTWDWPDGMSAIDRQKSTWSSNPISIPQDSSPRHPNPQH